VASHLELRFDRLWEELFPDIDLEAEVCLVPGRRFRYDYVHFEAKVAIEINGQIWRKGGHSSGKGLKRDYEKSNLAQLLGYCVFQLSEDMIEESWLNKIATKILENAALSKKQAKSQD
jgi:very-short-patch-repair endonuclease